MVLGAEGTSWYAHPNFFAGIRVALLVVLGFPVVFLLGAWGKRSLTKRFSAQQGMLVGKIVFYGGTLVLVTMVLHQLGFQLTALLGAVGIAGVAVGFASQTSVSNVISGLFLLVEKPFTVGDAITVGDVTGEVLSLDLLSVKLRTFDNKFVRIPNESLVKATVTNFSRFPIRRVDLTLSVAYREDLSRVKAVLLGIAERHPESLNEPAPVVLYSKFGDSAVEVFFGVWARKEDFLAVKNHLVEAVKARFAEEGIEIPFPHLSILPATDAAPLPVRVDAPGKPARRTGKGKA